MPAAAAATVSKRYKNVQEGQCWGGQSHLKANVFFLGEANVGEVNVGEVNAIASDFSFPEVLDTRNLDFFVRFSHK